ncbi:MAG: carboxypeptidase-like regulatory domain-containing protein, partial [Chitinophagaceae bacterium]|nr:carboxypeptidase-like regulatory domain-containing protein [Chitinophagaceae bacterium]
MKLTFLFILISCLNVSANGYGQEIKISLSMKEVAVGQVLRAIEKKTVYKFVYADDFFPSQLKVTVEVKEAPVSSILELILNHTGFTFRKVDEDLIVITSVRPDPLQREIRGVVTAASGQPMEGVTVAVQNSTVQTATNSNGQFTINAPQNAVLVFSYVGYHTQTFALDASNTINIVMEESVRDLSEVVVVGYGTRKRREVTNAITTINASEFNKGNISNVAQLLQGKVAGLSISRPGGDPNADFTLRLRGLSTLGSNAQPLIVLDDQIGADVNAVDPNDIKSIDVLKDGAAAAIYGTRGSAGVIIITTRSGGSGAPKIAYSASGTAEKAARFTSHMNAAEYRKQGAGNDYGGSTDWDKEITRTAVS